MSNENKDKDHPAPRDNKEQAMEMVAGIPLSLISKVFNHSSRKVTEIYARFAQKDLSAALDNDQDGPPLEATKNNQREAAMKEALRFAELVGERIAGEAAKSDARHTAEVLEKERRRQLHIHQLLERERRHSPQTIERFV